VVLAALYGGLPAGLLAAAFSAALADYFLLDPVHSFSIRDPADWLGLGLFLASCSLISWVAEAMHRAQARARQAEVQTGIEAARHREEEARALLAAIVESSEDAILSNDLNGRIHTWNAAAARIFGYQASDIIGKPATLLIPPDHLEEEERIIQRIARGERVGHYDSVRIAEDGRRIEVSVAVSPLRNAAGEIAGASRIIHDITERKLREESLARLNRTLKAHGASSQAMLRARDESQYLQEVCQIIVQSCGRAMVWIGFAEDDEEKTVRPAAWAGFEGNYLKTLNLTWADTERGRGPTGTAIRTGKPCACREMRTDPAFAPWREEALKHGYASSLVLPLLAAGKAFGAVTLYAQLPDAFSRDETELLYDLAGDLAQGIMVLRLRAERERTEVQLSLLSGAVESAANGVVITGRDGVIKWVNPAFSRLTGYSAVEAVGQNPRVLKSGAHPPEFYRDMWQTVLGGGVWSGELVNKRKDGTLYSE
jgi:PAS domain S-box-containing protein